MKNVKYIIGLSLLVVFTGCTKETYDGDLIPPQTQDLTAPQIQLKFEVNPHLFEFDGSMVCAVQIDGKEVTTGILGAFVNNECRGVADPLESPFGGIVYLLRVYSNKPTESIELKYKLNGTIYDVYSLEFSSDMILGNLIDPILLMN